jgi:tetratricopeptide (TPR) repeat protein
MQQEAIHKMHDQGDKYANAIEFEKRNLEVMEDQISIMKQKCLHQRRAMGGINASKDNFYMIQKQIRILENRLDKALIKFNEAIAHNKTLRDDIDDLRRERVVFENIYRKMERELQERKQKMAEIIETSNLSYEQRDTYQMEIAAIEQANRKEQEEFEVYIYICIYLCMCTYTNI